MQLLTTIALGLVTFAVVACTNSTPPPTSPVTSVASPTPSDEASNGDADGPGSLTSPHFPQLREGRDVMVMEAQLEGELVLENGCLRVKSMDGTGHLLIWPQRYKLSVDGADIRISDDLGLSLSVGEEVRIGGGEKSLARLHTLVEPAIPDDCPGPYWIVGEIPAQ